jgi:hypothetical protein
MSFKEIFKPLALGVATLFAYDYLKTQLQKINGK